MLGDARSALLDVLTNELAKLRRASGGADLLGEGERKCLETYARIIKLLEAGGKESEGAPQEWTPGKIEQVLGGGGEGLSMVREAAIIKRYNPPAGGARGWDDEAETSFSGLQLPDDGSKGPFR